jgi:hypothetical protein
MSARAPDDPIQPTMTTPKAARRSTVLLGDAVAAKPSRATAVFMAISPLFNQESNTEREIIQAAARTS